MNTLPKRLPYAFLAFLTCNLPGAWAQPQQATKDVSATTPPATTAPRVWLGDFKVDFQLQTTPALTPLPDAVVFAGSTVEKGISIEAERRFGFNVSEATDLNAVARGADPNIWYRNRYPTMNVFGAPSLNEPNTSGLGVEGVLAYRPNLAAQLPRTGDTVVPREQLAWRWQVPEELRKGSPYWSRQGYHGRYAELCVVGGGGFFVFSFDGATGLRWQAKIPVGEALRQYTLRTRAALSKDGAHGRLEAHSRSTQDGSRTLVTVTPGRSDLCFLFVYDAAGKLMQTRAFPGRNFSPGESIYKSPTADWFRLTLIWRDGPTDQAKEQHDLGYYGSGVWESYLFDRDGNPVRRFMDQRGNPALLSGSSDISDTHVSGGQGWREPDGTRRRKGLVFELPKLPSTAASLPKALGKKTTLNPVEPPLPPAPTNKKPGRPGIR